jgi:DNA-binding CsgD family transcriptional regulator
MFGRDAELAELLDLVTNLDGARLALVTGEAGLGKSRLVAELGDRLTDALVVVGRGVDLATGELPFGVFADTVRDLLSKRGEESLTRAERDLLAPLLPRVGGPADSDVARLISGAVAVFDRLADREAVVWVVEDLQWTDRATRDLVSVLTRRATGRLALVATVRIGDPRVAVRDPTFEPYLDGLLRLPETREVALERLAPDDARRQLGELLEESLPADAARRIIEIGDGVPFLIEELAAARGRPELSTSAAVAEARLAGLSGSARRLVDAAALGEGLLAWPLVEAVAGLSPEEMDEALVDAVRLGILVEAPDRSGVRFRHALLRDAADRAIPPAARRAWHRRWAEAIESHVGVLAADPSALATAEHWHLSGDPEPAARTALAAVPAARRTGGGPEELALWVRLLDLWPKAGHVLEATGVTRHDVLARVLQLAGSLEVVDALDLLDREAVRAADDLERMAIELRRTVVARPKGPLQRVILSPEEGSRREAAVRAALPDPLAVDALAALVYNLDLRIPEGLRLMTEVEGLASAAGDERGALLAAARLGWFRTAMGEPDEAADVLTRLVARSTTASTFELWMIEGNLVWCLLLSARYAEAERVIDRAAGRVPDPLAVGVNFEHIVENAMACWTNTGQWERAADLARRGRPYWGASLRTADVRLADLELLRTGRLSDPDGWRAAADNPGAGSDAAPQWISELVGHDAASRGDLAEFRRRLRPMWSTTEPGISSDSLWPAVLRALRAEGDAAVRRADPADRSAAEAHVGTIEAIAEQLHRFPGLGEAWHTEVVAQLARFRGQPCRELFSAAVTTWERVGHPYDAAVARLCLAEAEVGDDRRSARQDAEKALATARDLGAAPLEAAAEEILRRYRLVSTMVETPGRPGALTAKELEVLRLVAEGRTNEQIGAELFMAPKTASVHVSRITAKLGAANRTEAAAVARRAGLL